MGGCGGLERNNFVQCLILRVWSRCGGLERTDFEQFLFWDSVVLIERPDFEQILLWEGVVFLKELILKSFYFGRVWR